MVLAADLDLGRHLPPSRHRGLAKAIWFIVIIFLPLIGSLIYLISQGSSMAERSAEEARKKQEGFNAYVREQAGGSAGEIEKAKALLDSGAIRRGSSRSSRRRRSPDAKGQARSSRGLVSIAIMPAGA